MQSTLDSIIEPMQNIVSIVRNTTPASQVVLGETSSFAGEGAGKPPRYCWHLGCILPRVPAISLRTGTASDTFASVFVFLDKLALAAITGHHVVCHQTILDPTMNRQNQHEVTYEVIKEGYPVTANASWVMEHGTYNPTPNFWSSLLWKALMGEGVLGVGNSLDAGRAVRVYAHCTPEFNTTAATRLAPRYPAGSVTVMVISLQGSNATLQVPQSLCAAGATCSRDEYHLSPGQAAGLTATAARPPRPPPWAAPETLSVQAKCGATPHAFSLLYLGPVLCSTALVI